MSERLKHCRREYGWTQRDLARVSGLGLATVRRIEQGEFVPRLDTVRRLAETLHVRGGWLAFGEQPMLDLRHMTSEEQHRVRAQTHMEKGPNDVIVSHGPWYRDGKAWRVEGLPSEQEGSSER